MPAKVGASAMPLLHPVHVNFFTADTALMTYNNYADGRWNHFMDQTHLGYTSWNPPRKNSLEPLRLTELTVPDSSMLGVAVSSYKCLAEERAFLAGSTSTEGGGTRWMDVFNREEKNRLIAR